MGMKRRVRLARPPKNGDEKAYDDDRAPKNGDEKASIVPEKPRKMGMKRHDVASSPPKNGDEKATRRRSGPEKWG